MKTIHYQRALVSVSRKDHLAELAKFLAGRGVEILSTGGTAKLLRENGVAVKDVSEYTQSPEVMEGRVKTLHPRVHGGLLARRDEASHMDDLERLGGAPIDLVVVNLYPFESRRGQARHGHRRGGGEHRHRRPLHGPVGLQELRVRDRGRGPRGLR